MLFASPTAGNLENNRRVEVVPPRKLGIKSGHMFTEVNGGRDDIIIGITVTLPVPAGVLVKNSLGGGPDI